MTRSIQFFFARAPRSWSRPEHIKGVSVSETMPLAKIETMMVMENSRKMRPTRPLIKTSGRNTAAREMVMARIVKLISLADCKAASRAPRPPSMRRTVFSRKTMASSTKNPMASVRAIKDRLSRL